MTPFRFGSKPPLRSQIQQSIVVSSYIMCCVYGKEKTVPTAKEGQLHVLGTVDSQVASKAGIKGYSNEGWVTTSRQLLFRPSAQTLYIMTRVPKALLDALRAVR